VGFMGDISIYICACVWNLWDLWTLWDIMIYHDIYHDLYGTYGVYEHNWRGITMAIFRIRHPKWWLSMVVG
jgi:hypothetical protein